VFLCYNSKDQTEVKVVATELRAAGLCVWFDLWELRPGLPWQRALEVAIGSITAAAVFVGPNGTGPWQTVEVDAYLREFVRRGCPVIPVLLPSCPVAPALPLFLTGMTWVNLRGNRAAALERLLWGVTGRRPEGPHTPGKRRTLPDF